MTGFGEGRGLFVVLEGLDGSGTTTQLSHVSKAVAALGQPVTATCQPSDGDLRELIRSRLGSSESPDPVEMALLFAANRRQHIRQVVRKQLALGTHVVCDRYVLSSLAYQTSDGLDIDWLVHLNRYAPMPDVTIFLDTSVDVCLQRIAARSVERDYYHDPTRLRNVADCYRRVLATVPLLGQLIVVDGSAEEDSVTADIWEKLEPCLRSTSRRDAQRSILEALASSRSKRDPLEGRVTRRDLD